MYMTVYIVYLSISLHNTYLYNYTIVLCCVVWVLLEIDVPHHYH